MNQFQEAMTSMLSNHINKHIEQALALLVYVFRYPMNELKIKSYACEPKKAITFRNEEVFKMWLEPDKNNSSVIVTYIDGDIHDLMFYIPM